MGNRGTEAILETVTLLNGIVFRQREPIDLQFAHVRFGVLSVFIQLCLVIAFLAMPDSIA